MAEAARVRGVSWMAVVALVGLAVPAGADLPAVPGLPSFESPACIPGGDAGNDHGNASYYYPGGSWLPCTETLVHDLDEEDWFRLYAETGGWLAAGAFSLTADFDVCIYRPDDAATPVACSEQEGLGGDWVDVVPDQDGEWRIHVVLVAGSGAYHFSAFSGLAPPPPPHEPQPDFAVPWVRYEKARLRTDYAEGPVSPTGAWKLTALVENQGDRPDCRRIDFSIEPRGSVGSWGQVETWTCLGPGQSREVSVDWRPFALFPASGSLVGLTLGDVRIRAVADWVWEHDWMDNEASTEAFVVVGGI